MKKNAIYFLAILLLGTTTTLEAKSPKREVGLQLYSLREQMDANLNNCIDSVGIIGYKMVEAANYNEGKFYGLSPQEFRQKIEAKGMKLISSHVGNELPTEANYAEIMQWWDTTIAAHKAAGIKYIVQPRLGEEAFSSLDGLKRYCTYFNEIGKKCKAQGIKFGFHNHNQEFRKVDGEVIYDYLIANTNPKYVFFQIDLYWAKIGGADPIAYFDKYPGRFLLWHVKDKKEIGASGFMDFNQIYTKAKKAGLQYSIIEQEAFDCPPFQSVAQSLQYLQKLPYFSK